jgi:hypothetical protein
MLSEQSSVSGKSSKRDHGTNFRYGVIFLEITHAIQRSILMLIMQPRIQQRPRFKNHF